MKKIVVLIFALFIIATARTVYVPPAHWVYEFLERLETQRILPIVLSGTKPMTRNEIAEHLFPLYSSDSLRQRLSRVQRQQLDWLRVEFREELDRLGCQTISKETSWQRLTQHKWLRPWLPAQIYQNGRNMLSVKSDPFTLFLDPILKRQRTWTGADSLAQTEKVFENGNGWRLWGTVGSFGFWVDVRDHQQWGTRKYPGIVNYTQDRLGFVRGNANGLDHDETIAYLVYQYKYFTVSFGKDVNRWGLGYFGQLALSDWPTSYDQLRFSVGNCRLLALSDFAGALDRSQQ